MESYITNDKFFLKIQNESKLFVYLDNIIKSFFETNIRHNTKHSLEDLVKLAQIDYNKHKYRYYFDNEPYLATVRKIDNFDRDWINLELGIDLYKNGDIFKNVQDNEFRPGRFPFLKELVSKTEFANCIVAKYQNYRKITLHLLYPNKPEYSETTGIFFSFVGSYSDSDFE